jgi:hypothetical protein
LAANPNANPAGIGAVVPHVLDLLSYRVQLYEQTIPEEPIADAKAGLFLQNRLVWQQTMKPDQHAQAMQLMSDLISLASQHIDKADPGEKEQLARMIASSGASLSVIAGSYLQNQNLATKCRTVADVTPKMPSHEIRLRVGAVFPAIRQVSQFQKLVPPPTVKPAPAVEEMEQPAAEEIEEQPVEEQQEAEAPAQPATTGTAE